MPNNFDSTSDPTCARTFTRGAFSEFFQNCEGAIITEEDKTIVLQLQAECDRFQRQLETVNIDAAQRVIDAFQEEYRNNPSDESFSKFQNAVSTKDRLKAEHRVTRSVVRQAMLAFQRDQVGPTLAPILRRAADALEHYAEDLAEQERDAAQTAGVSHEPSNSLQVVRSRVTVLRDLAWKFSNREFPSEISPKDMLSGIFSL